MESKSTTDSGFSTENEINFLYEIGSLRHVLRTWVAFGGADFSNVAEHSFRVMWLSAVIANVEGASIERCIQIALVHDLGEARCGDVNYLTRMYVQQDDENAVKDSLDQTKLSEHFFGLWKEYKLCETLESRIVKDADNLDCDLELMEQFSKGEAIALKFRKTRDAVSKKLFTPTAKEIYSHIYNSDPHEWHLSAKNRYTQGDWQ